MINKKLWRLPSPQDPIVLQNDDDESIINLPRLRVNEIELFQRFIEIVDEMDDLTRIRINKIEFNHLSMRSSTISMKQWRKRMNKKERMKKRKKRKLPFSPSLPPPPIIVQEEEDEEKYFCL